MTGFVYFIRRGEFGSIKVGYSIDVQVVGQFECGGHNSSNN